MDTSARGKSNPRIDPFESQSGWVFIWGLPRDRDRLASPQTKKADVAEHPEVFDHVGLLVNEPPGQAGLPFT